MSLIRRIVATWDWSRFKPPVCARSDDGSLYVIDGQHTATAAASHGGIPVIPVMVVSVDAVADRAKAFIGHNRDRLAITPMQMHYSALAAGDEVAVAIDEACQRSGARIRRAPPPNGVYEAGDILAVGAVGDVVKRKGKVGGARVLGLLMEAKRAPISANEIKAVAALLFDEEYRDAFDVEDLAALIRSKSVDAWAGHAEATVRKGLKMPLWRAVSIAWFKAVPKRRRSAA